MPLNGACVGAGATEALGHARRDKVPAVIEVAGRKRAQLRRR